MREKRNITIAGLGCLFLLSGCSWLGDWPPGSSHQSANNSQVQAQQDYAQGLNTMAPAAGYQRAQQPPLPRRINSSVAANATPATLPRPLSAQQPVAPSSRAMPVAPVSKGMNLATSTMESSLEERIKRLEVAVLGIQNGMDKMLPALNRLSGIEKSLDALLVRDIAPAAGSAVGGRAFQEPTNLKPKNNRVRNVSAPESRNQVEPRSQAPSAPVALSIVRNVRLGEYSDKTRLVLDVSEPTDFRYDIDNDEKLLTIELPSAKWGALPYFKPDKSSLIRSYTAQSSSGSGSLLAIQLKQPAEILWADKLDPSGKNGYRIVLDVSSN